MKYRKSAQSLKVDKADKKKLCMLTAYDAITAGLLEAVGIEMILIGDSLGNVVAGFDNTLPVTMDHMLYHCQAVARGCERALLIADMPFMSYQVSDEKARENAGRLIKEGGAQAVKIEVFSNEDMSRIQSILNCGIPVIAHLGLTPQSVYQLGGYKRQAKNKSTEAQLIDRAEIAEDIGCFAVILECVPSDVAKTVQQTLTIPVIGIGAGPDCDGQVLVTQDLLGLSNKKVPSFVKQYAKLFEPMKKAISAFKEDVEQSTFPKA
ncbi:MAG: 3-methyl-2-oxobutanoate hydroxymethyltransferase [bacterium]